MRIFIKAFSGKTLAIEVGDSDTVRNVKAKIEEKGGIEYELQRLIYAGKQLEDGLVLSDYLIHKEATINMILREMPQISVQLMNEKTITVQVIPSRHTVEDVKVKIQQKEKIRPDQQVLIFQGKQLKDGHKLSSYGIQERSTINLVLREKGSFQVFIRTLTGKTITVVVSKTDTIRNVKTKIQCKNGVLPDQQRLMFGGRQLKDKQLISDYSGIKDESHLDLIASDDVFSADTACTLLARIGEQETLIIKLENKVADLERQMHRVREQVTFQSGKT